MALPVAASWTNWPLRERGGSAALVAAVPSPGAMQAGCTAVSTAPILFTSFAEVNEAAAKRASMGCIVAGFSGPSGLLGPVCRALCSF